MGINKWKMYPKGRAWTRDLNSQLQHAGMFHWLAWCCTVIITVAVLFWIRKLLFWAWTLQFALVFTTPYCLTPRLPLLFHTAVYFLKMWESEAPVLGRRKSKIRLSKSGEGSVGFSINSGRRRQWHPTPVLLPGKSHGQRSLVGCSPWGR